MGSRGPAPGAGVWACVGMEAVPAPTLASRERIGGAQLCKGSSITPVR